MLKKGSKYLIFIARLLACFMLANADAIAHGDKNAKDNVFFIENKNQWDAKVLFKAEIEGGAVFMEQNAFTYHFYDAETLRKNHIGKEKSIKPIKSHAFQMEMLNSNGNAMLLSENKQTNFKNYFIGNNPKNWASHVNIFQKITYKNIYKNIDLEVEGNQNSIKYSFVAEANSPINQIKLFYKGAQKLSIENDELHIYTSVNEVIDSKPIAWQIINGKQVDIVCKYKLVGDTLSFVIDPKYNPNYPVVIDPVLVFASYSGSTADNFGMTATYDAFGNLYAGGTAYDIGYPVTLGAYDGSFNGIVEYGRTDAVISKYNSTGNNLIYSTYLGGANGTEVINSMVVNDQNQLYVYGVTGANDFPITANAFDASFGGGDTAVYGQNGTYFYQGTDIYLARFSFDGTQLLNSTYIGGSENDGLNSSASLNYNYGDLYRGEINVDVNGNCIVGSCTYSANFPTTAGVLQANNAGLLDGCIFKFNASLQSLLYGSYFGGPNDDGIYSIDILDGHQIYVSGGTNSASLPAANNTLHTTFQGGLADGFVAKINFQNNSACRTSYIGTSSYDQSYFVKLDLSKNVYLFGQSLGNFPVQPANVYTNPNSGLFIIKLDSLLANISFSTLFGSGSGISDLSPSAFLVDDCNRIYISGWGGNIVTGVPTYNMPLTSNAFQSTTDGFNFYLGVFSPDMTGLNYGTYFGGSQSHEHVDGGTSRFDKKGIVYQSVCAGCGSNDDFPTTPDAWSEINGSNNCNNGVFKFDIEPKYIAADFEILPTNEGCAPFTFTVSSSVTSDDYFWNFGNNDTTSTQISPTRTFNTQGTYPITLIINSSSLCYLADTVTKYVTVLPPIEASFSALQVPCSNTFQFSDSSLINFPSVTSWHWDFGDSSISNLKNPLHTFATSGSYTVSLTVFNDDGCSDSISNVVTIQGLTAEPIISNACGNNLIQLSALPANAGAYLWNFGDIGAPNNTSTLMQTNHLYGDTGVYAAYLIVYWGPNNACSDTAFFDVNIRLPYVANFSYDVDSCTNKIVFIDISNNVNNNTVQWNWNFGDNNTAIIQNPTHTYAQGNSYTVTLIATATNGCIDTIAVPVILKQYASYFITPDSIVCKVPVQLQLQANGGDFYSWEPANIFNDDLIQNPTATISASTSISVLIGRINTDGDTCSTRFNSAIDVSTLYNFAIDVSAEQDTIFSGETSQLLADIPPNAVCIWLPTEGLNNATIYNPIASPSKTTEYTVNVSDNGVCSVSKKVKITVLNSGCGKPGIFVPNTFTPNGDGKNDQLFVRGNYIATLFFAVYNRWGEKVFETTDKKIGWDGFYKGTEADAGVFGWYLQVVCKDGEETILKGNVTLIR